MNGHPKADPFGLHVADQALNTILSSSQSEHGSNSQSRRQFNSLSALTTTASTAHDIACRLGLGMPQRIMVETQSSGPIVLTSYLHLPDHRELAPTDQSQGRLHLVDQNVSDVGAGDAPANGLDVEEDGMGNLHDSPSQNRSPLLIATVVASSSAEATEARRAAARLEKIGMDFQRHWTEKAR
ncbi:uncharacterized protein RAG0_07211 [Rhynchosporium agropyri]|uniref:Uncharacterized protein n=1 Tax=Rhynchosporium agropyri TaxID=914238 RepID=A0A1E1KKK0_9HELO|nr:uncharacterized protein RAG0_07211 [Rhynchosporium agropyri]